MTRLILRIYENAIDLASERCGYPVRSADRDWWLRCARLDFAGAYSAEIYNESCAGLGELSEEAEVDYMTFSVDVADWRAKKVIHG